MLAHGGDEEFMLAERTVIDDGVLDRRVQDLGAREYLRDILTGDLLGADREQDLGPRVGVDDVAGFI